MRRAQNADTRPMHSKNIGCPQQFPPLVQFCTGYRIRVASERNKRAKKVDFQTQLKFSRDKPHFFAISGRILTTWSLPIYCCLTCCPFSVNIYDCALSHTVIGKERNIKRCTIIRQMCPTPRPMPSPQRTNIISHEYKEKGKKKNFLCVVDVCLAWPVFKASSFFFFFLSRKFHEEQLRV